MSAIEKSKVHQVPEKVPGPGVKILPPSPCLPLSQAVLVDRTVYISGQLGLDVASGQLVDGGVQAQAKQVSHVTARSLSCSRCGIASTDVHPLQALINMGEILKAAGCDYTNGETPAHQMVALPLTWHWVRPLRGLNCFFLLVVKTTVLLADIDDFNSVNEVYKTCKLHRCFAANRKWWSVIRKQKPLGPMTSAHQQSPDRQGAPDTPDTGRPSHQALLDHRAGGPWSPTLLNHEDRH